jgi:signal transduction histidine kinase
LSFGILVLMGVSVGLIVSTARRAQRLARQQLEFVAGVSHELRTPVAVIGSAADNLAHGVVQDAGRVKQYGATIGTEARRLGETVERVLEFAGIQSGVLRQPTSISPVALVEQSLAASCRLVNDAHATIETTYSPDVPEVNGDASALRAVIENLIANAVKYGGAHAWVHVSVSSGAGRRGDEVRIRVEDRGIGIPASEQKRIFEPFFRGADALARHIHGNGLGLSIVKRVVEAHGGRVSVSSTPGSGSTFTVHLPVLRQPEPQPAPGDVHGRAVRADAR